MATFHMRFSSQGPFRLAFQPEERFRASMRNVIEVPVGEYYDGEYTVTPDAAGKTLRTRGLLMAQDVTVAPIPSNYGLITWDGSVLTVS